MEKIRDEKELLKKLFLDVDRSNKKKIVFLAGHFPLLYNQKGAFESFDMWGPFSEYTLKLACKVGEHAKEDGKEVKFVFFADDHLYESRSKLTSAQLSTRRNKLYKLRSGKDAKLPENYKKLMLEHGLSENYVIRHDHEKEGRRDCLYFSEKILRAANNDVEDLCAKEYIEFIENSGVFDKENFYMIGFIPQRCSDSICFFALDSQIRGLDSTHVFLDTTAELSSPNELYLVGHGVMYRRDFGT